jgi:putative flippase GtrA
MERLLHSERIRREGKTLVKFFIVGGTSFLMYFFSYLLFSRYLFPEGNRTLLNVFSICVSMIFNFLAHRTWTYSAKERSVSQLVRYLLVVGTTAALQSALFWVGYEVLGIYDLFVTVAVAGMSAIFSFMAHRLFTFNEGRVGSAQVGAMQFAEAENDEQGAGSS